MSFVFDSAFNIVRNTKRIIILVENWSDDYKLYQCA